MDRELAHQPWLEHSMTMAMEPGRDALRVARTVDLEVRAVYAAGYALGRLLAWQAYVLQRAPAFLQEALTMGVAAGTQSYRVPKALGPT